MTAVDFEQLGAFYLGRLVDEPGQTTSESPLLYDSKDLTTHAMCVGMTGSGKTGLCLSLLEEAAIDGVPAIAIDPKGDLGNLLLTFPRLAGEDFRPWVDSRKAEQSGQDLDAFAGSVAQTWKDGLADWGQDGARIQRLRDAVDLAIYTPGSSAGRQLSILDSLAAPTGDLDEEQRHERVSSVVSGLLALLGVDADPVRSREHILLSQLIDRAWHDLEDLDLATLIGKIQKPEIERVGAFALEDFFPANERRGLAMTLNNLLASPSFGRWLEGEPIDIKRLLWTDTGKPRISIISIAHLDDAERMFVVTMILNETLAWMRTQSGSSSLRALLYMDEVFGFFPPTANPPAKQPMLRLLKQARAFGLGVVLATQNPVDLDYKGLSNTGTWFLGRLQTKRDVERVIEGLEGASAQAGVEFDRQQTEALLAGLQSRQFYMHNVHDRGPSVFHTRWAMSYLCGPLTREQIKKLAQAKPKQEGDPAQAVSPAEIAAAKTKPKQKPKSDGGRPAVEEDVPESFATGGAGPYRPLLYGTAELHYASAPLDVDEWRQLVCEADLGSASSRSPWKESSVVESMPSRSDRPEEGATFESLPRSAAKASTYPRWEKSLKTHVYREFPLRVFACKKLKLASAPSEDEADFRIRVTDRAREVRDEKLDKLRERYQKRVERLQDQIARQEDRVEVQEDQVSEAKLNTTLSVGSTVLGALFGGKLASRTNVGKAASTVKRARKIAKEKDDVRRAKDKLSELRAKLAALEEKIATELAKASELAHPSSYEVAEKKIRPRKADTEVSEIALVWKPD